MIENRLRWIAPRAAEIHFTYSAAGQSIDPVRHDGISHTTGRRPTDRQDGLPSSAMTRLGSPPIRPTAKEMRLFERHSRLLALSLAVVLAGVVVNAGERRPSSSPYPTGMRYCPAPWSDNSDFFDTHYGIDAKTGQMIAYKGNVHPDEINNPPGTGEKVLYVSPPISVENRYVPPGSVQSLPSQPVAYPQQQAVRQPTAVSAVTAQSGYQGYYQTQPRVQPAPAPTQGQALAQLSRTPQPQKATPIQTRGQTNQGSQKQPWWKALGQVGKPHNAR